MSNHYETLGLNENASQDEIKKKYRKLSLKHHPDRGGDQEKFKEISVAYEILGDVAKRKQYDLERKGFMPGMHGMPGMPGMHGMPGDLNEMLSSLFGGGMGGMGGMGNMRQNGGGMPFPFHMSGMGGMPNVRIFHNGREVFKKRKPELITKTIHITIEESYQGKVQPIEIERWVSHGEIKQLEKETLYVELKEGIDDNETILIEGKGNMDSEDNKGDIKIVIKIKNKTKFSRNGLDIIFKKDLTFKESLVGFKFELAHLNGKTYTLNNDGNLIIKQGDKQSIKGLGFKRDGNVGNLIIDFNINYPEKLTKEQIEKLKEIL